ncbi:spinster family MFS transporter [Sphingomonas profundi]|uniref:spinster family MFS transporter n=1 Tax=Alterirhizorhabdus profundi TaxID=2681549 RepID=UPI0012E7F431|nr:MFS transporter [Sphingomonas profundi]
MSGGKAATRPHHVLAILYLVCLVSYVDRQVIALVATDIQRDLGLADWQLGFVSGTSFALLYVFMGIPLSYLADRRNRVRLLAGCLVAWSIMTAACGAAGSFVQLSLARVGVAIGEAGGYPASLSLIGDLYPPERRATVTAIFFSAVPAGTLISLYIGGIVAEAIGWRWTFVAAAAPGLLLALVLVLAIREPVRGAMEPGATPPATRARSPAEAVGLLLATFARLFCDPFYRWVAFAAALGSIEMFAIVIWAPTYAVRTFALGKAEVGQGLGLATGLISAAVMILTGRIADMLSRRTMAAPILMAAAGHGLCIMLLVAALSSRSFTLFCIFAALAYGATSASGPMTIAATQSRVAPETRATAAALLVMISTLAGYGAGPPLIGAISDVATGEPAKRLRTALLLGLIGTGLAALLLLRAARSARQA